MGTRLEIIGGALSATWAGVRVKKWTVSRPVAQWLCRRLIRSFLSDSVDMTRDALLRLLRAYAKEHGCSFRYEPRFGKGSHGRIWVNGAMTTVKSGDISRILKQEMLKQLGLPKDAV